MTTNILNYVSDDGGEDGAFLLKHFLVYISTSHIPLDTDSFMMMNNLTWQTKTQQTTITKSEVILWSECALF